LRFSAHYIVAENSRGFSLLTTKQLKTIQLQIIAKTPEKNILKK
jgi:hypothetical protein